MSVTRGENYDAVVKSQRMRAASTRDSVVGALRKIEQEIGEHGRYLENDGKVTLTEVARRAEVSAITLRNKHHHQTREIVRDWLTLLKQRAPTTKPKARKAAAEKIAWYEDALRKVNAEALKWRTELAKLNAENQTLRDQIASIQATESPTVVGFKSKEVKK